MISTGTATSSNNDFGHQVSPQRLSDSFVGDVFQLASDWIARRPTAANAEGLETVCADVAARLEAVGFSVERRTSTHHPTILVATRPTASSTWVGLTNHYDVEEVSTPHAWQTAPFELQHRDGRWWGRGVADNLGPLAQRVVLLEHAVAQRGALPSMVWVIQGEEEMASPFAHEVFPTLELPTFEVWFEETGYFERDGTQRLLAQRVETSRGQAIIETVRRVAECHGRDVAVHDRPLNKAFGTATCPALTHLMADRSYVALGPNDPDSRVHGVNESIPEAHVELSALQLLAAWKVVA